MENGPREGLGRNSAQKFDIITIANPALLPPTPRVEVGVKTMRVGAIAVLALTAGLSILNATKNVEAAQTREVPFFGIWRGGAYDNDQT